MSLWDLADLCTPWCLHVVATLQVARHIAAGRDRVEDIAAAAGAHSESLARVLRHLSGKGVFEEPEPGRFALNAPARELLQPGCEHGLDLAGFGGRMAYAWSTLLNAVRSGRPAYHEAFGRPFWEDLEANPEIAASFDALMGPGHGEPDWQVLPDPAAWASIRTVVDVGGGTGALLAGMLRAQPHLRGTLVDLPRTVARSRELFETAGVADRVEVAGQRFFDPLPAGRDLYTLKSVLSDWPDKEAGTILARCAEAAKPGGSVVLVNGVTPDDNPSPALLMMVLVGGKERSITGFRSLAAAAGLEVRAAVSQPSGRFVVECRPV